MAKQTKRTFDDLRLYKMTDEERVAIERAYFNARHRVPKPPPEPVEQLSIPDEAYMHVKGARR